MWLQKCCHYGYIILKKLAEGSAELRQRLSQPFLLLCTLAIQMLQMLLERKSMKSSEEQDEEVIYRSKISK